jgi:hypothetical protein
MADNRGPWLSSAMALFLVWTGLMYLVRVWAKLRTKSWGLDDWTITGAFVSVFPAEEVDLLTMLSGRRGDARSRYLLGNSAGLWSSRREHPAAGFGPNGDGIRSQSYQHRTRTNKCTVPLRKSAVLYHLCGIEQGIDSAVYCSPVVHRAANQASLHTRCTFHCLGDSIITRRCHAG